MRILTPVLVLLFLVTSSCVARADDPQIDEAQIDEAHESFQSSVALARKQLQERLDAKLEFAQRRGELELVVIITKEIEAFKAKGALPTTVPATGYLTAIDRELTKLENVYNLTIKECVREGLLDDARYLQEKIAKFKSLPAHHPTYASAEFEIASGAMSPQPLANGAKFFSDRTYTWDDVPEDFPFSRFARVHGKGKDPISFHVTSPGLVYIALADEHRERVVAFLREHNWEPTDQKFAYNLRRGKQTIYVFKRIFTTGDHQIPRVNFSGPTVLVP